ncbi:inner centromere protein-like [Oscarella lobularis]|uniref:inner centromere protein-like n=1 Tax=Oscarella lobularis TaxID=121494 RepID=UPI0033131D97
MIMSDEEETESDQSLSQQEPELIRPPPLASLSLSGLSLAPSTTFPALRSPLTSSGVSSSSGFEGGTHDESLIRRGPAGPSIDLLKRDNERLKLRLEEMEERLRQEFLARREVEEELKRRNVELSQTRRHLEIVEGDKEALRHQERIWRDEIVEKMKLVESLEKQKNDTAVDRERLKRQIESDKIKIKNLEAELAQQKTIPPQRNYSTMTSRSSFPQLVSGNPLTNNPPEIVHRTPSFPIRSPKSPEIHWHPKEDIDSSPPRTTLAEDQYAPLQAWLRKNKMEAAFSGAYAVQGTRDSHFSVRSEESNYLECPKCDKRFDSRDFSSYRQHLEECLK